MERQADMLKRKVNKVPLALYSRLVVWCEANRPRIAGLYVAEIATTCQKELAIDLPLVGSTFRTICRSLTIPFKEKKQGNPGGINGKLSPAQRLAALEKQVAELTNRLANLEISLGGVRN